MLRFRSYPAPSASGFPALVASARRQRWRTWMLLMALGLVVVAMRHLGKPGAARQLGVLFSHPAGVSDSPPAPSPAVESPAAEFPAVVSPAVVSSGRGTEPPAIVPPAAPSPESGLAGAKRLDSNSLASSPGPDQTDRQAAPHPPSSVAEGVPGLSRVKDKTYFRPAEQEAWLHLFARLQQAPLERPVDAPAVEVAYAQLLKQPDVYRGQWVTIQGTVLREEVQPPGENPLGIGAYHRLWIRPQGGGNSPFVVYCLRLPRGVPRGDNLRCGVTVTGYFFKNWSFSWGQGLALAPTVLASSFSWTGPVGSASAAADSWTSSWERSPGTFVGAAACVGGLGLAIAWLAMRSTARPRPRVEQPAGGLRLPDDWAVPDSVGLKIAPPAKDESRQ